MKREMIVVRGLRGEAGVRVGLAIGMQIDLCAPGTLG